MEKHEYTIINAENGGRVLLCTKCLQAMWIGIGFDLPFECGGEEPYEGELYGGIRHRKPRSPGQR